MRIDSLMLVGDNLVGRSLSLPGAVEAARRSGCDAIVVAPAKPRDYRLDLANERLAEVARDLPGVYRLARVDPNLGEDSVDTARRAVRDLGCVGIYLDPEEEVFRIQAAAAVVREAAALGVPVVVSTGITGRSEPLQVLDLATEVPEATLVLTSGGQINISGLSMIDAWFALTASPRLLVLSNGEYRQDHLERIVRELGPQRLLYASMAPRYEPAFEAARIASARMDVDARSLVEGGNAARIWGITVGFGS